MKNPCLLVHYISSFEGISYKRIQDKASLPVPLFLVVLHHITIYIRRYHFYNLQLLHIILIQHLLGKIFLTNFHSLTDSPKPPTPLTAKIRQA